MSAQVFKELEQGTPEWIAARCGVLTASVVGGLVSAKTLKVAANETSRGIAATLAAERITGHVEEIPPSRDMERGTLDEPLARAEYADRMGVTVDEVGFMLASYPQGRFGYSPDGLVGDAGLIEIKSRRQKKHLTTILEDAVPLENMAQIQAGLMVSGREWCDYVSYCGGMPLYIRRVLPDVAWHQAIQIAHAEFESRVEALIYDYRERTDGLPVTERIEHWTNGEIY